jgi:hypothetical protein
MQGFMISQLLGIATIVMILGASSAGHYPQAWWLTARFEPRATAIEGISTGDLDRTWVAVTVLQGAALPSQASLPGESIQDHGGVFELMGDFDKDNRLDKALVGVYRTNSGEVGRFLLVLSATQGDRWSRRALFKEPGEAGFSVLFQRNNNLVWAFCMECDAACDVTPRRRAWTLKCESC